MSRNHSQHRSRSDTHETLLRETLSHLTLTRDSAADLRRAVFDLRALEADRARHLELAAQHFHWRDEWLSVVERSRSELVESWRTFRTISSLDVENTLAKLTCWGGAQIQSHGVQVDGVPWSFIDLCCAIPSQVAHEITPLEGGEFMRYRSPRVPPNLPFNLISSYGDWGELLHKVSGVVDDGLLYQEQGRTRGFIAWKEVGNVSELRVLVLWVDPLERRRGIASELLRQALKIAVAREKKDVIVEVTQPSDALRGALVTNGFSLGWGTHISVGAPIEKRFAFVTHSKRVFARKMFEQRAQSFIKAVGGREVALALCSARQAYHRMCLPPPDNRQIVAARIQHLHREDQLTGKVREKKLHAMDSYRAFRQAKLGLGRDLQGLDEAVADPGHTPSTLQVLDSFRNAAATIKEKAPFQNLFDDSLHAPIHWKFRNAKPLRNEQGELVSLEDSKRFDLQRLLVGQPITAELPSNEAIEQLFYVKEAVRVGVSFDGEIAGFGAAIVQRDCTEILSVIIDPSKVKRGFGSKIVDYFIAIGSSAGSYEITALMNESNDAAIKLFTECGFTGRMVRNEEQHKPQKIRMSYKLHR